MNNTTSKIIVLSITKEDYTPLGIWKYMRGYLAQIKEAKNVEDAQEYKGHLFYLVYNDDLKKWYGVFPIGGGMFSRIGGYKTTKNETVEEVKRVLTTLHPSFIAARKQEMFDAMQGTRVQAYEYLSYVTT